MNDNERKKMFEMKERFGDVGFVILRYFGNRQNFRLDGIEKTYRDEEYQTALEELLEISRKKPGLYVLAGTGYDLIQLEEVCFKALIGAMDGRTELVDVDELVNAPTDWSDDDGAMETVKKTVQLPEHTVVFDWGKSPAESPYGPYVPNQDESISIDFSEYAADFNVDSFWNTHYYMRVYIAPGGIKCDPDTPYQIYYGGIDSGRTQNDEPWSLDENITFEVEATTEITYFE